MQVSSRRLTPMLQQYLDAKAECPSGALLLFRMGDFYELFFEDAAVAARELDLTLTSRDKGDDPIPMAGVPHHAVTQYIARLIARGYTVAICDQIEDPREAKGLVRRAITRLITPGTVSDLEALESTSRNYLGYVRGRGGRVTLVLLELLAGELLCTELELSALADELSRMRVRELLVEREDEARVTAALAKSRVTPRALATPAPSPQEALEALRALYPKQPPHPLEPDEAVGLCRVVRYAEATQHRVLVHFLPPRRYRVADYLVLDEAARRNLELLRSGPSGEKHGSLLWHLDHCVTAMGSRLLGHWLLFPLRDKAAIIRRQEVVAALKVEREVRSELFSLFCHVRDGERLTGRVALGRATPRDLGALRETLGVVPKIRALMAKDRGSLGQRWAALDAVSDVHAKLAAALVDEPPTSDNGGAIFRRGFDGELDQLIELSEGGHGYLLELEHRERERTGISNLKVRFNKVFGYYIEVTRANLANVPHDYVRKQTLVGAERFITEELKRYEDKVISADERRKTCERELFAVLSAQVGEEIGRLRVLFRLLAETDALAALAKVADEQRYERPTLVDEPIIELLESRHPVVERLLPRGERFVPNDVSLDADARQLMIITGPNMAGKSTVMRQVALCVLLAQMGSFVPAKAARIGLCDRIFTRVGAADHLGAGESTFMVEMIETATILAHATRQSLVLLDEVGRGTSTFDGVAIAWAVVEHLHDESGCRTLFATHYHELVELALTHPRVVNMSVAVKEQSDAVVFLRRLVAGAANRSYGIEVARLAALPPRVLARAREILASLERKEFDAGARLASSDVGFHEAVRPGYDSLRAELMSLDVEHMTPVEALLTLARLREHAEEK